MSRAKAAATGGLCVYRNALAAFLCAWVFSTALWGQAPSTPPRQPAPAPWRFAGARPCAGPEGGILQCPPAARVVAIRAGRLFDSISGQMLTRQMIVVSGEQITEVGPEGQVRVPAGTPVENTIVAGCDTVEHGYGLTQRQLDTMVQKGLAFDPTLVRYTEPYMDDNDAKNTEGKFRMIPIFDKAVAMAVATKGLKVMVGSGADGSTYPHGTQALDFEALVTRSKMSPIRVIQAGTIVNAEVMGWQNEIGSLTTGKFADVVAVQGNPLTDITELQRVKFVMKGGKVVRNDLVAAPVSGTR